MAKKEKKKNILTMDIKDINFGIKKVKVPTKTTLNLYVDPNPSNPLRYVAVIAVLVLATVLIYRFGVVDRMTRLDDLRSRNTRLNNQYQELNAKLYGYDEVSDKYYRYTKFYLTDNESSLPEMSEIMDIIDNTVGRLARIYNMTLSGNNVSMSVSVEKIEDFATIRELLYGYLNVDNIQVYYANKDTDRESSSSLVSGAVSFDVWKGDK